MNPNTKNNRQPLPVRSNLFDQHRLLLSVIGAVVIVAVAIFLGYRHHQNQQKAAQAANQPYAFTYKDLSNQSIAGQQAGSGMIFSVPSQLKTTGPTGKGVVQAQFNQTLVNQQHGVQAASLDVASVYTTAAPSSIYLKDLASNLANTKGSAYATAVGPIKGFVSNQLSGVYTSNYNFSYSAAAPFKTTNISSNAWFMNFTATPPSGTSENTQPSLNGKVVLAVGKNTYYYYMIDAVDYNWTAKANQSVWQQATDSLKIDQ